MPDPVIKVSEVMRTELHKINGLATAREAITQMERLGVSSLVIERRRPDDEYGLLSVRHIAAKVLGENRSIDRISVYQVMAKPAVTVSAEMNVKYAIRLLARFGLTRALVTRDNELVGLVTLRDLVIGFAKVKELPPPPEA